MCLNYQHIVTQKPTFCGSCLNCSKVIFPSIWSNTAWEIKKKKFPRSTFILCKDGALQSFYRVRPSRPRLAFYSILMGRNVSIHKAYQTYQADQQEGKRREKRTIWTMDYFEGDLCRADEHRAVCVNGVFVLHSDTNRVLSKQTATAR